MTQFCKETRRRWKKDQRYGFREMLLEWITLQRSKNLRVSRKLIQRRAMIYAEEKAASKGQINDFRFAVARPRRKKLQSK